MTRKEFKTSHHNVTEIEIDAVPGKYTGKYIWHSIDDEVWGLPDPLCECF